MVQISEKPIMINWRLQYPAAGQPWRTLFWDSISSQTGASKTLLKSRWTSGLDVHALRRRIQRWNQPVRIILSSSCWKHEVSFLFFRKNIFSIFHDPGATRPRSSTMSNICRQPLILPQAERLSELVIRHLLGDKRELGDVFPLSWFLPGGCRHYIIAYVN